MPDDLDISDDVIEFFENLGNEEVAPAEEAATAEVEAAATEEEAPAEGTETEEAAAEEEPATEEEVDETPEEEKPWEQRYKELQSHKDQQVAQLQNNLNQLQDWAQKQYEWTQQVQQQFQQQAQQTQQQAQPPQVTAEQLTQAIDNDIVDTFQWVAANRPDLVPTMASMVRENEKYGHRVADQMLFEYQQYELAKREQAREAQIQQTEAPQQVEAAMGTILTSLESKFGDTFTGLKDEIASEAAVKAPMFKQYMAQNNLEITPQAVADFISGVYFEIREQKLNAVAAAPRKAQKLTPEQHVENASALNQAEVTSDEAAINEIMAGAKNLGIDVATAS